MPDLAHLTSQELANMTGCHLKTAQRWKNNAHGISAGHLKMIHLGQGGHLVPDDWQRDFKFINGFAVIENGNYVFSYDDLCGYWLRIQQFEWSQRDLKAARDENTALIDKIRVLQSQAQEAANRHHQQPATITPIR